MKIEKTLKNPHGLSAKEQMVIADMVKTVAKGKPMDPVASTKKFYSVSSENAANVIASRNMHDVDFRTALIEGLEGKKILGRNSKIEAKLEAGLEAVDKEGNTDFKAVLSYIQEINKITGVYAPERKETRSLKLSVDMSQEELDRRIKSLQKELEEV